MMNSLLCKVVESVDVPIALAGKFNVARRGIFDAEFLVQQHLKDIDWTQYATATVTITIEAELKP